MQVRLIPSVLRICAVATLVFSGYSGWGAQPTTTRTGLTAPVQAVDRSSVTAEILNAWNDYKIPVDSENQTPYGPFDLRRSLKMATPEQLLDARNAKTFDDVVAALPRNTGGGVVSRAFARGEAIPLVLGDAGDDLVFTPVTPCRIMDTRFQTVPARIGPDAGVQRNVVGTDYSAQGGFAGSCGIPSTGAAAVSINIVTTNQSGTGSLRVIASFAGNPPVSILNYSPIQNIGNAAVVAATTGAGPNIWVYSASAATDVIIDIMGYFNPPAATALDCTTVTSALTPVPAGVWTGVQADCPAGYSVTGGGFYTPEGSGGWPGVWTQGFPNGNGWLMGFDNQTSGPRNVQTYCRCCRIPGH